MTSAVQDLVRQCCDLWRTIGGEEAMLLSGGDIRAYMSGGMWVHPCGKTFQTGGRDGFEHDYGEEHCSCGLCAALRTEMEGE